MGMDMQLKVMPISSRQPKLSHKRVMVILLVPRFEPDGTAYIGEQHNWDADLAGSLQE